MAENQIMVKCGCPIALVLEIYCYWILANLGLVSQTVSFGIISKQTIVFVWQVLK